MNILQLEDRLKNQNECVGHTLLGAKGTGQVTPQGAETDIYVNSQKNGLRGKKRKKGWREGRAGREKTEGGRRKGEEERRREGGNI